MFIGTHFCVLILCVLGDIGFVYGSMNTPGTHPRKGALRPIIIMMAVRQQLLLSLIR